MGSEKRKTYWVKGRSVEADKVVFSVEELTKYLRTDLKNEKILLDETVDLKILGETGCGMSMTAMKIAESFNERFIFSHDSNIYRQKHHNQKSKESKK